MHCRTTTYDADHCGDGDAYKTQEQDWLDAKRTIQHAVAISRPSLKRGQRGELNHDDSYL